MNSCLLMRATTLRRGSRDVELAKAPSLARTIEQPDTGTLLVHGRFTAATHLPHVSHDLSRQELTKRNATVLRVDAFGGHIVASAATDIVPLALRSIRSSKLASWPGTSSRPASRDVASRKAEFVRSDAKN